MLSRRAVSTGLAATTMLPVFPKPSLAAAPLLFVAWKGVSNDSDIYLNIGPNAGFGFPSSGLNGFGTSTRPALVQAGSKILMAWKGAGNDGSIYMSAFTGSTNPPPSPQGPNNWSPRQSIPNVGTTFGPALTPWNNSAFMAWKGTGSDVGIWGGFFDANLTASSINQFVTGITSGFGPAMVTFNNRIIMAWRGVDDYDGIYWAISGDGRGWVHMGQIPGATTSDVPAMTVYNGQILMVFRGNGSDNNIYATRLTDVGDLANYKGSWAAPWNIPGMGTTFGPSICTIGNVMFMSWKGSQDDNIWYSSSTTGNANDWKVSYGPIQAILKFPGKTGGFSTDIPGTSIGPAVASFNS